jgi:peptide/nickel transport system substrate-binding protein
MYRFFTSAMLPPEGSNWSGYRNDQVDDLLRRAFETFDPRQRDELIGQAHAHIIDDAAWAFVVHDLNPRALSPKVKGFVPVQSWIQDFTQVTVDR